MSGRGLAAFVAGFGTGFLNNEERKRQAEQEDKRDKRAQEEHDLRMRELQRKEAQDQREADLNEEIAAIPKETYGSKREMTADDVRGMVGGSGNEGDANYVSDDAAQHYINNNTGAQQVASNAASYAKQGIGSLNGMKPVQGEDGAVKLADPATAKARPSWRIMEEAAKKRIGSGIPQQEQLGFQALAYAQTLKSQEARDGAMKAYQSGGLDGVMKFMSEWDNDDYPISNIRMEAGEGGYDPKNPKGRVKFIGEVNGKPVTLKEYDLDNMPDGATLEDAVMNDVQALTDPKAMFDIRSRQFQMRREDRKEDRQQGNIDRAFDYSKDRDAVKDKQFQLSFDAQEAGRRWEQRFKTQAHADDQQYRQDSIQLDREKLAATNGKNGEKTRDQFRQDYNAALTAFDKSFKRDAMGNMVGNELDSKLYAGAADVIGKEIQQGASIAEAQATGRQVYDMARKGKVSVDAAYDILKKNGSQGAAPIAAGGGAAAVDGFFNQ
jgi:hypothetical protein